MKISVQKTTTNFYLHLDKLWKMDGTSLINKKGKWKVTFDGGSDDDEWKFSKGVSHFYMISDLNVFFRQLY